MHGRHLRLHPRHVGSKRDLRGRFRISTYLQHGIYSSSGSYPRLCVTKKGNGVLAGEVATAPRQSHEAAVRFGDDNTRGILDSFWLRLKFFPSRA